MRVGQAKGRLLFSIAHLFVVIFFPSLSFCIIEQILGNRLVKVIGVVRTNPRHFQFKLLVLGGISVRQVDSTQGQPTTNEREGETDILAAL
jgi:hypothetical protein